MKKFLMMAVLGASSMLGLSCGGSGSSCTVGAGATAVCVEYTGAGVDAAALATACTAGTSTSGVAGVTGTGCTRTGAVGGCRLTIGTITSTQWYYTGTVADVTALCAPSGATFVSP